MIINSLPTDYNRILHIWALRISSVQLLGLTGIAESESLSLAELNINDAFRTKDGESIIPWGLRVLVIKVQTQQHPQVGVVKYYALAREARVQCWRLANKMDAKPKVDLDPDSILESETSRKESLANEELRDLKALYESWCDRLLQCGLFIAATLSRMKDYGAAFDHVSAMLDSCINEHDRIRVIQVMSLLCVEAGDAKRASEWFSQLPNHTADPILQTPTAEVESALGALKITPPPPAVIIEAAKSPKSPTSPQPPAERDALFDNLSKISSPTSSSPSSFTTTLEKSFTTTVSGQSGRVKLDDQTTSHIDSSSRCNLAIANLYEGNIDMVWTLQLSSTQPYYLFDFLFFLLIQNRRETRLQICLLLVSGLQTLLTTFASLLI